MIGRTGPTTQLKPVLLFAIMLGTIFFAELLIMLSIPLLPKMPLVVEALVDACLVSFITIPFLYCFFLKPLLRNIERQRQDEVERERFLRIDLIKNEFISTAAHELRTPLATIMGYTELLTNRELSCTIDDDERDGFLSEIYSSSIRLNRIVDDILDVSRIESGQRISLNMQPLSIADLLEKVVERFRLQSRHTIELQVSREVPEELSFDKHRIEQVMENLLSNAIKYSPKKNTIKVVAEADGHQCKITVIDRGIGMSEEQQAHMFDKFYRANTSNTAVRGLGLGMHIVNNIIRDHDGTIRVESQPGEGTQVSFTLPFPEQQATR